MLGGAAFCLLSWSWSVVDCAKAGAARHSPTALEINNNRFMVVSCGAALQWKATPSEGWLFRPLGESNAADERLVIWLAAGIVMYSCVKPEGGMLRAGTIIALLGLTVILAGCSKCASPFGTPGACHSDAPSTG